MRPARAYDTETIILSEGTYCGADLSVDVKPHPERGIVHTCRCRPRMFMSEPCHRCHCVTCKQEIAQLEAFKKTNIIRARKRARRARR